MWRAIGNPEFRKLPVALQGMLLKPRKARHGIPDEIKAFILAEPVAVSNYTVAHRYLVSMRSVARLRKENGIISRGMEKNVNHPGRKGWRSVAPEKLPGGNMDTRKYNATPEQLQTIATELKSHGFEFDPTKPMGEMTAKGFDVAYTIDLGTVAITVVKHPFGEEGFFWSAVEKQLGPAA